MVVAIVMVAVVVVLVVVVLVTAILMAIVMVVATVLLIMSDGNNLVASLNNCDAAETSDGGGIPMHIALDTCATSRDRGSTKSSKSEPMHPPSAPPRCVDRMRQALQYILKSKLFIWDTCGQQLSARALFGDSLRPSDWLREK